MSAQLRPRPARHRDELDDVGPWSILSIASVFEAGVSTTTRLGMPFVVRSLDDAPFDTEGMTGARTSWAPQFWKTYVTATETGISYVEPCRPISYGSPDPAGRDRPPHPTHTPADRPGNRRGSALAERLGQGRSDSQ